jgi:hypothetical protein
MSLAKSRRRMAKPLSGRGSHVTPVAKFKRARTRKTQHCFALRMARKHLRPTISTTLSHQLTVALLQLMV